MKKLTTLFMAVALLAVAFTACKPDDGGKGETKELKLSADTQTIKADGTDAVTFTVTYGDNAVTDAKIMTGADELDGYTFTTTVVGEYKFVAIADGKTSNEITITAKEPGTVSTLVLSADKLQIYPVAADVATFTVTLDGEDVTADSKIFDNEGAIHEGSAFSTTADGTYTFHATYDLDGQILRSESLAITTKSIPALTVKTTKPNIFGNGTDATTFTVAVGSENVTDGASLFVDNTPLTGDSFSSTSIGEHQVHATYTHDMFGAMESDPLTVKVVNAAKHVAYFTLTGTWCGPCYQQKVNMKEMIKVYGDNIVQIQIQTTQGLQPENIGGVAPHSSMRTALSQFANSFSVNSVPTTAVDLWKKFTGYSMSTIESAFNSCLSDVKTGMNVTSSISGGKVNVSVEVTALEAANYSLGILLVEDHIVGYQNGGGNSYDHTNVARQMGAASIFGDSITGGVMSAGTSSTKQFSFDVDAGYKAENLSVVVYTIYQNNGKPNVDNAIKIPANGSGGY